MYRALYRKWRPAVFNDVCGQPHVVRVLKNQLQSGRISHAYLFAGSRGTGKTTCAKIFAKAVNCLDPADGEPCNKCEICRGIDSGDVLDAVEIDAASNNGVDNIRALREETNFTPARAKYRVYIVDEAHMLSAGAFNALLKTLEEPPPHVIFILATTEIHKLPATVVSRCQRFDFKRVSAEDIKKRLLFVADKENVRLTDDAASLIARAADGGMRDALSLLDRCLTSSDFVDEAAVADAAGILGTDRLFAVSEYVLNGDCSGVLKLISKLYAESCDADSLRSELALHFRNLAVAKTVEDCGELIPLSKNELSKLKERARAFPLPKIMFCLETLEKTAAELKEAANKKILLEAALIKTCSFPSEKSEAPSGEIEAKISALEEKIEALSLNAEKPAERPKPKTDDEPEKPSEEPKPKAEEEPVKITEQTPPSGSPENLKEGSPDVLETPAENWPEVLEKLKLYDAPLFGILANAEASIKDGRLLISSANRALGDCVRSDVHSKELFRAVGEVMGKSFKIEISEKEEKNPPETETEIQKKQDAGFPW